MLYVLLKGNFHVSKLFRLFMTSFNESYEYKLPTPGRKANN